MTLRTNITTTNVTAVLFAHAAEVLHAKRLDSFIRADTSKTHALTAGDCQVLKNGILSTVLLNSVAVPTTRIFTRAFMGATVA